MAGEVTVRAGKQRGSAMEGKGRAGGNRAGQDGQSAPALLAGQRCSDEPWLWLAKRHRGTGGVQQARL